MSQPRPPSIIKIKRKATDEPLEYLRIHEGKRQRTGEDYIFSRQPDPSDASSTSQPASQATRRIKQPRSTSSLVKRTSNTSSLGPSVSSLRSQATTPNTSRPGTPLDIDQAPIAVTQPRRFHISRSAASTDPLGPSPSGSIRKRKAEPTLFVERRVCRPKSGHGSSEDDKVLTFKKEDGLAKAVDGAIKNLDVPSLKVVDSEPVHARKKPGLASRVSTPVKATPSATPKVIPNVVLPSGRTMQWDVEDEQLALEMQAYTLQEIGKNLAEIETPASKPLNTPSRKSTPSKFKPKAPQKRYAERHPEVKSQNGVDMDIDEPYEEYEEIDSDGDYVIDTYVRMPAAEVGEVDPEERAKFGVLVVESEIDQREFYCEDPDSDEEEFDEEEDENAEDHYTADYPEDEVSSDDEYDRNPYSYRHRSATDLEEYDEADATFSEDEGEDTMHPWTAKPWLKKRTIMDDGYE